MEPASQKNSGQWIAQCSAFAAVVAILLTFILRGRLGWLPVGLLAGGLVLAIVALFSMRRFGTKGIAPRAIIGLLLNGLLLSSLAGRLTGLGLPPAPDHARYLPGAWRTEMPLQDGPATLAFVFRADGTGSMITQTATPMDLDFAWRVERRELRITPIAIRKGPQSLLHEEQSAGLLIDVNETQLKLRGSMGDETYDRLPTTRPATKAGA